MRLCSALRISHTQVMPIRQFVRCWRRCSYHRHRLAAAVRIVGIVAEAEGTLQVSVTSCLVGGLLRPSDFEVCVCIGPTGVCLVGDGRTWVQDKAGLPMTQSRKRQARRHAGSDGGCRAVTRCSSWRESANQVEAGQRLGSSLDRSWPP